MSGQYRIGILDGGSNCNFNRSLLITAHSYQETHYHNTNTETLNEMQGNVLNRLKTKMDLRAIQFGDSGDQVEAVETYEGAILADEQILPWFWRECEHPGQSLLWLYENVIQRPLINAVIGKLPQNRLIGVYTSQTPTTTIDQDKALASSVAYKLTQKIPGLAPYVKQAINEHPAIFGGGFASQFEPLVVLPLKTYIQAEAERDARIYPASTKLFIIDDLDDHLGFNTLQGYLKIISETLQKHQVPLVFFVASRRQHPGNRDSWVSGFTKGIVEVVHLAVADG